MIHTFKTDFTREFFYNDHIRSVLEAEHLSNDTWYFYPLSMVGCMFPWSIYVFAALAYLFKRLRTALTPAYLFMACWIGVVFVIFQSAHSKLISYIFPLFPALAIICGDFIYNYASAEGKNRLFLKLSLASVISLGVLPIAAAIGMFTYPDYLPNKIPLLIFILVFAGYMAISLSFIFRRQFLKGIYSFTFTIPLFLLFIGGINKDIEPYVSSRNACSFLMKNYNLKGPLLCSKFFLRGVRYYTDKEVAVMDPGGTNFFSLHPVVYLNSIEQVSDFLNKQSLSYYILKKSVLDDIEKAVSNRGRCEVIRQIGNGYIVKVEFTKS